MSSIAGTASLLAAALDLKLVQDIRGAIQAADKASARADEPLIGQRPWAPLTSESIHYTEHTRLQHAEHYRIIHTQTVAAPPCHPCHPIYKTECQPAERPASPPVGFTIQPPWSVLPWQNPAPIKRTVKMIIVRPDILHKGTLIDSFI